MAATLSDKLIIFDTTLRDGEQAPGIALSPDDKVAIAHQLARLKVDVIEAGFAASSPGDFEAVSRIAAEVKGSVIASLARTHPDDIDRAADALKAADRKRIHVFISTSPIHREQMLRMTEAEVLDAITESVTRAKQYCDDIEFSPQDATRTHPDFVVETCRRAVAAGATTINIPDTVGYAVPSDFVALMERVYADVRGGNDAVIISTHCHNDLGLAVANSLSAIHAGARQIEGAINGLGERAGNTSTEEVIMAVKTREDYFGVEVGADTTEIFETSRLVARLGRSVGLYVLEIVNRAVPGGGVQLRAVVPVVLPRARRFLLSCASWTTCTGRTSPRCCCWSTSPSTSRRNASCSSARTGTWSWRTCGASMPCSTWRPSPTIP